MNTHIDKILYRIGLCIGVLIFLLGMILGIGHRQLNALFLPCAFRVITGLYCPGCGGTRAVEALLRGKLLLSLLYHPFVIYSIVIYVWYMLSNTIQILSKHKIPIGMRFKTGYLWIAIALILLNWIAKNVILLLYR